MTWGTEAEDGAHCGPCMGPHVLQSRTADVTKPWAKGNGQDEEVVVFGQGGQGEMQRRCM